MHFHLDQRRAKGTKTPTAAPGRELLTANGPQVTLETARSAARKEGCCARGFADAIYRFPSSHDENAIPQSSLHCTEYGTQSNEGQGQVGYSVRSHKWRRRASV